MEELVIKSGLIYLFSLIGVFLLFRKMLYSIFDPAIWIIPLFSSLITFSFYTDLFGYIVGSVLVFWLGMFVVNKNKVKRRFTSTEQTNILTLEVFTEFVFIVYALSCIYVFKTSGIPLLSDNPTESKVAVFEGMGILKRISFIGSLLPINLSLLICCATNKKKYIVLLVIYTIIKLLLGSKSSVIGLIFPIFYFITQKNLNSKPIDLRQYRKYIGAIIAVAVAIFVVIVSKEAVIEDTNPLYSMGFRLMEFGDVMLYYPLENVRALFTDYNFLRFIPDELNGILGMLRLAPYNEPLGFIMAQEAAGKFLDTLLGPNIPLPIKGHIYGGAFGGLVYSFIVGVIFAQVRDYFFSMKIRDLYYYSIIAFIFFNLMGLIRQSEAFISLVFDYFFYTMPILFISQIMVRRYAKRRFIKNIH